MRYVSLISLSGGYDDLKAAALDYLPRIPELVRAAFTDKLKALKVQDISWRSKMDVAVLADGTPIYMLGGEALWRGQDIDTLKQAVLVCGQECPGAWVCVFAPGRMGFDVWVFNFTLAVKKL